MLAPPRPPAHDELEALIREARARQRRRWFLAAAAILLAAGVSVGIYSAISGGRPVRTGVIGRSGPVVSSPECHVRIAGPTIVQRGQVVYREPSPEAMWSSVHCSGSTIWALFVNSVGMMHQGYVGVRSLDSGRSWRVVLAQDSRARAKYGMGAEVGPWTLHGTRAAYFVGTCPACSLGKAFGTVWLTVTTNAGRTFRSDAVPALAGWAPLRIRVTGYGVTIWAKQLVRKINSPPFEIYRHKTVTLHVA